MIEKDKDNPSTIYLDLIRSIVYLDTLTSKTLIKLILLTLLIDLVIDLIDR